MLPKWQSFLGLTPKNDKHVLEKHKSELHFPFGARCRNQPLGVNNEPHEVQLCTKPNKRNPDVPPNLKVCEGSYLCFIFLKFALLNCSLLVTLVILCGVFKYVVVIHLEVFLTENVRSSISSAL